MPARAGSPTQLQSPCAATTSDSGMPGANSPAASAARSASMKWTFAIPASAASARAAATWAGLKSMPVTRQCGFAAASVRAENP
jgi:hypothetical protein